MSLKNTGITNRFYSCCQSEDIVVVLGKRQSLLHNLLDALLVEWEVDGIFALQICHVDHINLVVRIAIHQILARLVGFRITINYIRYILVIQEILYFL